VSGPATATYVLVHGGAHGGWCYGRVAPLLRAAGHEVFAPTLTGVGERAHLLSPDIDLDTHIQDVVQVLRYEDLRDVILVGHSYGGMVITGVADRARGRVVDGVELVLFPGTEPLPHYGVTDPDDIAWLEERLTPHPFRCFEQPLVLHDEAAVAAIPQTHIVCTSTLPTRDPARWATAEGRVWDVDTGHDLMITEPKAVAELLLRVAAI
jgi:hypothetical protein